MDVLTITRPDGATIAMTGELDVMGAEQLRSRLADLELEGDELHLDLSGLEFLDSMGLASLIDLARAVHARGGSMRTTSPPGSEARLVIDLSGLAPQLGLEPSV